MVPPQLGGRWGVDDCGPGVSDTSGSRFLGSLGHHVSRETIVFLTQPSMARKGVMTIVGNVIPAGQKRVLTPLFLKRGLVRHLVQWIRDLPRKPGIRLPCSTNLVFLL